MGDAIIITDFEGNIVYGNDSFLDEIKAGEEIIGESLVEVVDENRLPEFDIIVNQLLSGESIPSDIDVEVKDGTNLPISIRPFLIKDSEGNPIGIVVSARDVSERKKLEITDSLTGVYNRGHFNNTIDREVERCSRDGVPLSFIMIDVNRFKEVNDRYGHHIGDEVLKNIAEVLQRSIRDMDMVVRYGGDEFLIVLPESLPDDVEQVIKRIRNGMEQENQELIDFNLTLAMGKSTLFPKESRRIEEVLKEADTRMYENKTEMGEGR